MAAAAAAEPAEATEEELQGGARALWQRLKRRWLCCSRRRRSLEEGLSINRSSGRRWRRWRPTTAVAPGDDDATTSELVGSQQAAAEAQAEHVQRAAIHGRDCAQARAQGASAPAPRPRRPHRAAARVGARGLLAERRHRARADKGIDVETIVDILPGCVTDDLSARRPPPRGALPVRDRRAAHARFGVWVGGAARRGRRRVLRRWRELACPPATPLGPSRSHVPWQRVRPSPVATGSSTARPLDGGRRAEFLLWRRHRHRRRRSRSTRCRNDATAWSSSGRARASRGPSPPRGSRARIGFSSSASAPRMPTFSRARRRRCGRRRRARDRVSRRGAWDRR